MPREQKELWEFALLALLAGLIVFLASAPVHPFIARAFKPAPRPEQVQVIFVPEARVPRTGSRGDGDYGRWRREVSASR